MTDSLLKKGLVQLPKDRGMTMLHGDLADLIRRAQEVAADPKADRCPGMCIEPEALWLRWVIPFSTSDRPRH